MGLSLHRLALEHGHASRVDAPELPGMPEEIAPQIERGSQEARRWSWVRRARRRRQAYAPELVHAHLATPAMAGAAWLIAAGAPLVLTFQLLPDGHTFPRDYLLRLPSAFVLRRLARRRGAHFVAVSRNDRERLSARFPGAPLALAPNRSVPQWTAAEPSYALPYPEGVVRLLSVGRLVTQKGFDRMLAALASAAVRELPWHWLIVGEGPERGALERSIASLGLNDKVQLLGALDARGLFQQADMVLCPSRYEGAPLVPTEALQAQVPVLLSRIEPHLELAGALEPGILPAAESVWPSQLEPLLRAADARARLVEQQAALRCEDPAHALWSDYLGVYSRVLSHA